MVQFDFDNARCIGTVVLRPNQSWTWRANKLLVYTLMCISGIIAINFTIRGLWLVLPFTVLEMSALIACLAYCVRRGRRQEVLTMSMEEVRLQQGHDRPEHEVAYPRFFARFRVEAPRHPWYDMRLALEARGERHEIGAFLSRDEKRQLVSGLRSIVHRLEG